MPRLESLVGGSYPERATQADAERAINWYAHRLESPGAGTKTQAIMMPKPGLSLFCHPVAIGWWTSGGPNSASASSIYSLYQVNGRVFALSNYLLNGNTQSGSLFWEITSGGGSNVYINGSSPLAANGAVSATGAPAMIANQNYVLATAGGSAYVFNLGSNTLSAVSGPPWGSAAVASPNFLDGYFILRQLNSQTYWVSNLNDPTTWNALNFGSAEGQAGNVQGLIVNDLLLWFFCTDHAEAYYDNENATGSPFSRMDNAVIPQGMGANATLCLCDNTIFWLSANTNQGFGQVFRANGYSPQRISTFALENAMQSWPTVSDATAYAYQDGGHTFYRLDFPSAPGINGQAGAGQTWVYDCALKIWHERSYWNGSYHQRDLAQCHTMMGTNHLVGDYQNGNIYIQSQNYSTDNGAAIVRARIAPDFASGGHRTYYGEQTLQIGVSMGLDGNPSATPTLALQISNDGGQTWGNPITRSLGSPSAWKTILRWASLGSSYNRCYQWTCAEKVAVQLIACDHAYSS